MRYNSFIFCVGCLGLAFSAAVSAQAQNTINAQGIDVSSDRLVIRQTQSQATFVGNVKVKHKNMQLAAQELHVYYQGNPAADSGSDADTVASSVRQIEATGGVTIVMGADTATGDKAVYNLPQQQVRLTGNVVLVRGENVLKGKELVYNLADGSIRVEGNGGSEGRVRARFITPQNDTKSKTD